MTDFTKQLRRLLSEDDFDTVFGVLEPFLVTIAPNQNLLNDVVMVQGSRTAAERGYFKNEISRDDYTLEIAKVRRAVSIIIDEIDTTKFDESSANTLIKGVLRDKPMVVSLRKWGNAQKSASLGLSGLLLTGAVYYFAVTDKKTPSTETTVVKSAPTKPPIKPSDFDTYWNEAKRIRHTVGQDNYTTEDGRMRARKAKILLDTALMAKPDDAVAYNERADCYMILGKLDSALLDIDAAISHDSYLTYTYATRAQVKALKGDVEGFYADLEEALMREHDVWRMRNSLGVRDHRYDNRFIKLLKKYKQYKE